MNKNNYYGTIAERINYPTESGNKGSFGNRRNETQQRNSNNLNKNNYEKIKDFDIKEIVQDIEKNGALSKTLIPEEINLPGRMGHKIGKNLSNNNGKKDDSKSLNTNQLRKYFQLISNVMSIEDFTEQRNELFKVLPQIAYAAGRKVCPKDFYYLIEACISEKALQEKKDVEALVEFLTAIVAYSKLESK